MKEKKNNINAKQSDILKVKKSNSKRKSSKLFSKEFVTSLAPKWITSYLPDNWNTDDQSNKDNGNKSDSDGEDNVDGGEHNNNGQQEKTSAPSQFASAPLMQKFRNITSNVNGREDVECKADVPSFGFSSPGRNKPDSIFKSYKQSTRLPSTNINNSLPDQGMSSMSSNTLRPPRRLGSLCNSPRRGLPSSANASLWVNDHSSSTPGVCVKRVDISSLTRTPPVRHSLKKRLAQDASKRRVSPQQSLLPSDTSATLHANGEQCAESVVQTPPLRELDNDPNTSNNYNMFKRREQNFLNSTRNCKLYTNITNEDLNNSKLDDLSSTNMDSSILSPKQPRVNSTASNRYAFVEYPSSTDVSIAGSNNTTTTGNSSRYCFKRGQQSGFSLCIDSPADVKSTPEEVNGTSNASKHNVPAHDVQDNKRSSNHCDFMDKLINSPEIRKIKRKSSVIDSVIKSPKYKRSEGSKFVETQKLFYPKISDDRLQSKNIEKPLVNDSLSAMFGSRITQVPSMKSYTKIDSYSSGQNGSFDSNRNKLSSPSFFPPKNTSVLPCLNRDKALGTWQCNVCLCNNVNMSSTCSACVTPKPKFTSIKQDVNSPSCKSDQPSTTQDQTNTGNTKNKETSLSAMFSNDSNKKWECAVCMCSNDNSLSKCPACETEKPTTKQVVKEVSKGSLASVFSSKTVGKWECATCLCSNDSAMTKCPACETLKPSSNPSITDKGLLPTTVTTNSLSTLFSKKSADKWECPTCMCSNDSNMQKCPACETKKPTSSSKSDASTIVNIPKVSEENSLSKLFANKGKSDKWECPTCMCSNEKKLLKCPACETNQPGVKVAEISPNIPSNDSPKFNFGSKITSSSEDKGTKPNQNWSFGGNLANKDGSDKTGFKLAGKKEETTSDKPALGGIKFGSNPDKKESNLPSIDFKFGSNNKTDPSKEKPSFGDIKFGFQSDKKENPSIEKSSFGDFKFGSQSDNKANLTKEKPSGGFKFGFNSDKKDEIDIEKSLFKGEKFGETSSNANFKVPSFGNSKPFTNKVEEETSTITGSDIHESVASFTTPNFRNTSGSYDFNVPLIIRGPSISSIKPVDDFDPIFQIPKPYKL